MTGNKEHNLVFMVVNGTISSCLDGEFKLGEAQVSLWNTNNTFDQESEEETDETIEIKFSDALHAVQSVVSSSLVSMQSLSHAEKGLLLHAPIVP